MINITGTVLQALAAGGLASTAMDTRKARTDTEETNKVLKLNKLKADIAAVPNAATYLNPTMTPSVKQAMGIMSGFGGNNINLKPFAMGGMNSQKATVAMQSASAQVESRRNMLEVRKMVRNQRKGGNV